MRDARGWNRRLDQISSGIYENAVKLQRRERHQLARMAAALQFRMKVADLKQEVRASVLSLSAC